STFNFKETWIDASLAVEHKQDRTEDINKSDINTLTGQKISNLNKALKKKFLNKKTAKLKAKVEPSKRNLIQTLSKNRKIVNTENETAIDYVQQSDVEPAKNGVRNDVKLELRNNCGLCDYSSNYEALKLHLKDHWVENILKCQLCEYIGRDFADMVTHRSKHYPKSSLFCFVCDCKIANALLLQFHFREQHMNTIGGWCLQ
ncbi:unnamed protein product, partial [Leptidea sinapis]